MNKIATVALAALIAGSGTYAIAQDAAPAKLATASQETGRWEGRRALTQDDFSRLVDARIAAIKAGLKLSADQEKLWGPVEEAIRTSADERFSNREERRASREERRSMDFMQRLERHSTMVTERAERSAALTTALRPLWETFSEDQKRIAPSLMHQAIGGGKGWGHHGGRHGRGERHAHMRWDDRGGKGGPRHQAPEIR